mmetsp:Transcript_3113/g.8230  ORF Transcript_3113/g.8230 Transcript_3113/m.8230 type:complete len:204 (-) Transcript_3113:330-941(-)
MHEVQGVVATAIITIVTAPSTSIIVIPRRLHPFPLHSCCCSCSISIWQSGITNILQGLSCSCSIPRIQHRLPQELVELCMVPCLSPFDGLAAAGQQLQAISKLWVHQPCRCCSTRGRVCRGGLACSEHHGLELLALGRLANLHGLDGQVALAVHIQRLERIINLLLLLLWFLLTRPCRGGPHRLPHTHSTAIHRPTSCSSSCC